MRNCIGYFKNQPCNIPCNRESETKEKYIREMKEIQQHRRDTKKNQSSKIDENVCFE